MNLTEVLLAVIVSLAVIAGGYTLYTNVSDKNEVAQVMQNVSLLRANIEDAYDGNYENLSSDASDGSLYDLGILPERLARVSSGGTTPATKWGPITIEAGDDPSTYTISFSGLSKDICLHLGRFQYRSWAKVEAGGTAVWTRGTDTGLKTAELVQACKDYGELEALFGPDEEGLAAKTEAAVRGYLLHGNPIPEFLKPEEDILDKAAAEIAEAQERGLDDEEAECLISEVVTDCIAEVTTSVAMREARS